MGGVARRASLVTEGHDRGVLSSGLNRRHRSTHAPSLGHVEEVAKLRTGLGGVLSVVLLSDVSRGYCVAGTSETSVV